MRPQLVFVHGVGGPRSAEVERRNWTQALAEGARLAGHGRFADGLAEDTWDVRFVVYGDLFDAAGAQGPGLELDEQTAADLIGLLTEMIDDHLALEHLDEQTTMILEQARAQLDPPGQAQGPGNAVRIAINAATTLMSIWPLRRAGQWLSGRLLLGDLAQVVRYLARGETDSIGQTLDHRIRARLTDLLADRSTVLVSHSLGSVVAFEALHQHEGDVPLWVTLGSPIGMRTVVWPRLRPQPPCTPDTIGSWLNFWDRDDIIVARRNLAADLEINSRGVSPVGRPVDSAGLWVHTATKYLAQPAVAGPIAEAMQHTAAAQ